MTVVLPRLFSSRASAPPQRALKGAGRAAFGIALIATLVALIAQTQLWSLGSLDARLYDIGISEARHSSPLDIMIVGIDEGLMQGRHPYLAPRDRLARLLRIVATGKPSVVVLDVFLDSYLDHTPNGQDAKLRAALAEVKASGIPILISDLSSEELIGRDEDVGQSGSTTHGGALPFFRQVVTDTGSVLFENDKDEVVRRMFPTKGLTPIPLLAARFHSKRQHDGRNEAYWKALEARLQDEKVPIAFCGPPGTINQNYSAAQTLTQPFFAPLFEGKIIFIGANYPRSHDVGLTPYSLYASENPKMASMYGVELLAQSTQTLLEGAPRHSELTFRAQVFTSLFTFLLALLVTALAVRINGTRNGVLVALIALLGTAIIAMLSARDAGPLWGYRFHPASQAWLAVPLACAAAIAWREWHEARELSHVREAFEAYVGPQVLKQLSGKMPVLGGEVRPVTVLFCDIRGYSALAETMRDDPEALLRELNGHFSPLVGALKSRHAHVDNYVGDLIMALWCEPLSGRNPTQNARDAVSAALDIERLVRERNEARSTQGLPSIEVGIGLHCGEAVVGNLGGRAGKDSKIHYTAIGDVVNLASRVESATRGFNLPLLVTREIKEQCGEDAGFQWEFVAQTNVKGRQNTIDVFQVNFATPHSE